MAVLKRAAEMILTLSVVLCSAAVSHGSEIIPPPATYHLSFETLDFIKNDDFSGKYQTPTIEQRKLSLVPGKFGKAFFNANEYSSEEVEQTAMSTWDLDALLEVLVLHRFEYWQKFPKSGRLEPYIWGTGRLTTDGGSVAFWAKGARTEPGYLFFQASSSFGRHEKYLLAIELNKDRSLSAYVRDARYVYHRIASKPVWDSSRFNHVALSWDRAEGLRLFLNGEEIASNWSADAWWTTQMPGLFHMPMCGFTYDEFWIFDRPLAGGEINRLMKENRPPSDTSAQKALTIVSAGRIARSFIGENISRLPAVKPLRDVGTVTFREIYPEFAGEGCVHAPYVMDGKYELAWPHDYTTFTNILGDSDFHGEKVDFRLPRGSEANYIILEGNLDGVKVFAQGGTDTREVCSVPQGSNHFFGAAFNPLTTDEFSIPLLKGYGSPPGYKEGLNLALTGDTRIQEAGFFHIGAESSPLPGVSRTFYLSSGGTVPDDDRCGYAMRALNDRRNARILSIREISGNTRLWISPGACSRLNFLSAPWKQAEAVSAVELNLFVRKAAGKDFAVLRIHDPGVPARIWTSVVFSLENFRPEGDTLRVCLDCADIKMAPGDRIWLDLLFNGDEEIETGGSRSSVTIAVVPLSTSDGRYAFKELQPAFGEYSRIYPWYYPWMDTRIDPDLENPPTFGGYYDVVTYPLIIKRTEPDNFLTNALLKLTLIPYVEKAGVYSTVNAWENTPSLWPPIPISSTDGSPDWAFFMRWYLKGYKEIVSWWAKHQNPDGQVGGGWKDDALFAQRLTGVFLYLGDEQARKIFDRIYEGIEKTKLFADGYSNYVPNDYIHVDDLTRSRYEGMLYDLGNPHKMLIAMRTAWRFEKPEQTPINYVDGNSFKYDRDFLLWYWGETPLYPAYTSSVKQIEAKMREIAPAMNDVTRFRYTETNVYSDYSYMPGSNDIKHVMIGGQPGPWLAGLTMAVSWEKGGCPDIPKWVESATDTSLAVHFYSYAGTEQEIEGVLYRLKHGMYRITLEYEGKDKAKGKIVDWIEELERFSAVSVPVRQNREMVFKISLVKKLPDYGPLPDLALSDIKREGDAISVDIYNFGSVKSPAVKVRLMDWAGKNLGESEIPAIESAKDFIPKHVMVSFSLPKGQKGLHLVVDPENKVREIVKRNNTLSLSDNP
jgi:hypothetical protein